MQHSSWSLTLKDIQQEKRNLFTTRKLEGIIKDKLPKHAEYLILDPAMLTREKPPSLMGGTCVS